MDIFVIIFSRCLISFTTDLNSSLASISVTASVVLKVKYFCLELQHSHPSPPEQTFSSTLGHFAQVQSNIEDLFVAGRCSLSLRNNNFFSLTVVVFSCCHAGCFLLIRTKNLCRTMRNFIT